MAVRADLPLGTSLAVGLGAPSPGHIESSRLCRILGCAGGLLCRVFGAYVSVVA